MRTLFLIASVFFLLLGWGQKTLAEETALSENLRIESHEAASSEDEETAPRKAIPKDRKTTHQQNRMKVCAAQYREKKLPKAEYRTFMRKCLRKNKALPHHSSRNP